MSIFTSGSGNAEGSTFFESASFADEVYPLLQRLFPRHSVSRLDACVDFFGQTSWDNIEEKLTEICTKRRVLMSPSGAGHKRPDGSRNKTKGRSWYCGGKFSPFQVVFYEKGLMNIGKGIPDDPQRVRLEVRVRPKSNAKRSVGEMKPKPEDLFGMSKWGIDIADYLGIGGIQRVNIGTVYQSKIGTKDDDQLIGRIVRIFGKGIGYAMKRLSPEEFGNMLKDEQGRQQQARDILRKVASSHFESGLVSAG